VKETFEFCELQCCTPVDFFNISTNEIAFIIVTIHSNMSASSLSASSSSPAAHSSISGSTSIASEAKRRSSQGGKLGQLRRNERGSKSLRAGLNFPVGRISRYLRRGHYADRIGSVAPVYLAAVLEYLSAEILELAGNSARDNKRSRITPRHIQLAIRNDDELNKLFGSALLSSVGLAGGLGLMAVPPPLPPPARQVPPSVRPPIDSPPGPCTCKSAHPNRKIPCRRRNRLTDPDLVCECFEYYRNHLGDTTYCTVRCDCWCSEDPHARLRPL